MNVFAPLMNVLAILMWFLATAICVLAIVGLSLYFADDRRRIKARQPRVRPDIRHAAAAVYIVGFTVYAALQILVQGIIPVVLAHTTATLTVLWICIAALTCVLWVIKPRSKIRNEQWLRWTATIVAVAIPPIAILAPVIKFVRWASRGVWGFVTSVFRFLGNLPATLVDYLNNLLGLDGQYPVFGKIVLGLLLAVAALGLLLFVSQWFEYWLRPKKEAAAAKPPQKKQPEPQPDEKPKKLPFQQRNWDRKAWFIVPPAWRGVVLLFGKPIRHRGAGLSLKAPFGIETIVFIDQQTRTFKFRTDMLPTAGIKELPADRAPVSVPIPTDKITEPPHV
ncbi:MAG: hypothetical protein HY460_02275, partial [Parcubacteria group bacterium]|nr:hypothetical protein [Parcubacteria group bacterium]